MPNRVTLERVPHAKQIACRTMLLCGYTWNKISKTLGMARDTISMISKVIPADDKEVETCKRSLVNEAYGLSRRAWLRVTDEKLEAMNALQLTTIGAIGIDKARDMEGSNRPVFNIVNVVGELESKLSQLDLKQKAIAQLEAQSSTENGNEGAH